MKRISYTLIFLLMGLVMVSCEMVETLESIQKSNAYLKRYAENKKKIQQRTSPVSALPAPTSENELSFEAVVKSAPKNLMLLRFSADGKYLLTTDYSDLKSVSIWDIASGSKIRRFSGHTDIIRDACLSPDNRYIVTVSSAVAKLWETTSGKMLRTLGLEQGGTDWDAGFTKGGSQVVISGPNGGKFWNVITGKTITLKKNIDDGKSYFSPDGSRAVELEAKTYKHHLVDVRSRRRIITFHRNTSHSKFFFNLDGSRLITQTSDFKKPDMLHVWDSKTGQKIGSFQAGNDLMRVVISPKSSYMATIHWRSGIQTLHLWHLPTFKKIETLFSQKGHLASTVFSPDEKYFALSGHKNMSADPKNHKIKQLAIIFETSTGKPVKTFSHDQFTIKVGFSPDNRHFALSMKELAIYETDTGQMVKQFKGTEDTHIITAFFSPDRSSIVTSGTGGIRYWDLKKKGILKQLEANTAKITLSPNGKYIAGIIGMKKGEKYEYGTSMNTFGLWDVASGKQIRTFSGHLSTINTLKFSPDGKYIATGSGFMDTPQKKSLDNSVRIWNVSTGQEIKKFDHLYWIKSVGFRLDGQVIAAGSGGYTIKTGKETSLFNSQTTVWDIRTGKTIKTLKGGNGVKFSPDNKYLVTCDLFYDSNEFDIASHVRVWDAKTFKNLKTLTWRPPAGSYYFASFSAVEFSPDGKYMVTISDTASSGWIWNIKTGKLVSIFQEPKMIFSVAISPNGKYVLVTSGGSLKLRNIETGKEVISLISVGKTGWVSKTPQGFFDASSGAEQNVYYVRGMKIYDMDQFFEDFFRPNLFGMIYSGKALKLPKINIAKKIQQSPPPVVTFISPKPGSVPSKRTMTIRLSVSDSGGGISEIKLLQNGKRISETTRAIKVVGKTNGSALTRSYQISLIKGKNTLVASAFSRGRIESRPVTLNILFKGDAKSSTVHLVAVGINTYQNKRLNLNYARPDAESFVRLISKKGKKLFKNIDITTLYDKNANRKNILKTLDKMASVTRPEDVFVFFYAGHGSMVDNQYYFVTSEAVRLYDKEKLTAQAISMETFQEKFSRIKALKQLVVIDACQSGAILETVAFRGAVEEKALAQLARSTGVHILAATGSEQLASEFKQLGHGVFTYAILEALGGKADGAPKDGRITVFELKAYIDDKVPQLTEKFKGEAQYPNTFSRGQDFPLILK